MAVAMSPAVSGLAQTKSDMEHENYLITAELTINRNETSGIQGYVNIEHGS
jgi:hypothetical protein